MNELPDKQQGMAGKNRRRTSLKEIASILRKRQDFCSKQWERFLSRRASVPDSPFHVKVALSQSQSDWVDVEVYYSARWAGGTTASFSVPFKALFVASDLARALYAELDKREVER